MAPLGVKLWTWVWNLWGWVYGLAAWFVNWALGLCGGFVFCSALDYNRLSGPIPPSLGGLSKLTWFDVAYNGLTGPIPVSKTIPRDWVLTPCQTFSTCKSPSPGHLLPCQTVFLGSVFTLIYVEESQGYISSLFLLVLGGVWYFCSHMNDNAFSGSLPPEMGLNAINCVHV